MTFELGRTRQFIFAVKAHYIDHRIGARLASTLL
jgi:hypothetical protein